ncbi:MAG: hypothetical protein K2Z80_01690 [Xanthobacteraceae bacterium]|nr:hypothetical protein [Xanthobacteraceae bacterium]
MLPAGGIILRPATPDDIAAMMEISAEARSRYKTIAAYEYVEATPAVTEGRFRAGRSVVAETPRGRSSALP